MRTRITEPTQITQGDRVAWTRTIDGYSAEDYDLEYRFRGPDGPGFNVTADADGDDFDAEITAAQSAAAKAGKYAWQAWLTESTDNDNTFAIQAGETTIKPGFASSRKAAADLRSKAKIMLDTIDAALLAAGSADMIEYEISTPAGSRRVRRESRKDVIDQRKYWATIVINEAARERVRSGKPLLQNIQVRVR